LRGASGDDSKSSVAVVVVLFSRGSAKSDESDHAPNVLLELVSAALLSRCGFEVQLTVLTMIEQIHRDVERYMLNRVVLKAILGVVTGVIFAVYGLEHVAIWGLTRASR
jgi:hypothetical protein